ncbi:hypothetical protein PENTCL1PPCAC_17741, partial [Pristionchus entomophagus]
GSLFVLGASHPYPETVFPMLGECLRRQRGDLALRLLKRYKDNSVKLGLILDRLLDSSQHRMYNKYKSNAVYFLDRDQIVGPVIERGERPTMIASMGYLLKEKKKEKGEEKKNEDEEKGEEMMEEKEEEGPSSRRPSIQQSVGSWESGGGGGRGGGERSSIDESEESAGAEDRSSISTRRSSDEGNDSSCNSLSHSGSHFPCSGRMGGMGGMSGYGQRPSIGSINNPGGVRMNKKTRLTFPCEAHSHYMVELAKRILIEAGGDQSSSVFIHAPNHNGPHRKLLMCSFLTGLYALGLSNKASSTWASRTYSTHSGCLTQQALEIGSPALSVMAETWSLHFTPSEAASLADKAGRLNDRSSVELGAHLALSVLSHSHALSCSEGIRALDQCKDQGYQFLEKAIYAVEEASTRDEVFPEILFRASHLWAETVSLNDTQSHPLPPHSLFPFNGVPPLAPNPFYHHATVMQQQQQVAAAQSGGGGGSAPPLPQIQYPGGGGYIPPIRGEGDGSNDNVPSGGMGGPGPSSIHRPMMHLSHSAPNLNGVMGPPPSPPPPSSHSITH